MNLVPHGPANTRQVKNNMATGLVEGCEVTINSGNSKQFDVAEGTLRFLDSTTDPLKPVFAEKFFAGETGIDIITTGISTHIAIDNTLTVIAESFTGLDTPTQNRSRVELSVAIHFGDNPIILMAPTYSNICINTQLSSTDLMRAVGRIRQDGLRISANGVNLSLDRSSGTEYSPFFENFFSNQLDPSNLALSAVTALSFFHSWMDGSGDWNTSSFITVVNPGSYDDGTGGATEPNGVVSNNSAQIMRVYEVNQSFGVLYGQETYISIAAAVDALATEQFEPSIFFIDTAFRGFLVVRGGATDLSNPADALFFNPMTDFVLQRSG